MTNEIITDAEMIDAPEWAWELADTIVLGNQGQGNAAVLIHRAFTAQLAEARQAERAAVVAWLRGRADGCDRLATECGPETDFDKARHSLKIMALARREEATTIEAGEHLA